MTISNLHIGDEITYSYKEKVYTGKICKHIKNIISELINDKNILTYEVNKYYLILKNNNCIINFDDSNKNIIILDIKRKESLLI